MSLIRASVSPVFLCIVVVVTLFLIFAELAVRTPPVKASSDQFVVFTNPAVIAPVDRITNVAGSNPGVPAANYPSPIAVSGLTGTVSKVTVTFSITSTFPDDFDILLVGPTGARSLVMSDAGGSGDPVNVQYIWDQAGAGLMPDAPTTIVPAGTFQPSNYAGLPAPEPAGADNFPTAGGLMVYPTSFNIFNGTNPNGIWNLYVVDDQVIDTMSLPSGWSINITTAVSADAPYDFNGDNRSDYVVVRNVGGGPSGQIRWFTALAGSATPGAADWGIATDRFIIEDFDGDNKDDIAVWRATEGRFYILESIGATARIDTFGLLGDDPTVVGDYDGDGKADVAVYRSGAAFGDQSTWFYRGSLTPANINYVPWGTNGDFPGPGDYNGDGRFDFVVQRNGGGGQARFFRLFSDGTTDMVVFGTPTDIIVPGDYDGDGKCDLAVTRGSGGSLLWFWRPSGGTPDVQVAFGASATDFRVQGDYDGDGKVEPAIWRPNIDPNQNYFWSLSSTGGGAQAFELGQNGDYPAGNFNAH